MLNKKTLHDLDVTNNRTLVRVDFNVPLDDQQQVTDDTRIRAALPTINYLIEHNAKVILCSHLGRPADAPDPQFSLRPTAVRLSELIGQPVAFAEDCIGPVAQTAVDTLGNGQVLILENTRFHPGEKKNTPEMSQQLADLADLYVNDAFGSAHRAHASTAGVAKLLPAAAGFLMEKEIQYLGQAVENPQRPFVAIIGGAKISDKIGVIENLLAKSDKVLIGGGMANTFFKAQGVDVADSLVEEDALPTAADLLSANTDKLLLPVDVVLADKFAEDAAHQNQTVGDVPAGWRILDIGPKTVEAYTEALQGAQTVVWNGPMGVFEFPTFAKGTIGVAQAVAECEGVTIIGGGDSVAAINQAGLSDQVSHISTGGGASLEMLEGKTLPGLAALDDR